MPKIKSSPVNEQQSVFDESDDMIIEEDNMDMDSEDSEISDTEDDTKIRETSVETYLEWIRKQFIPIKFGKENNSLDMVMDKRFIPIVFDVKNNSLDTKKSNTEQWHCSSRHKALKKDTDLNNICSLTDKQFWIESAVLGGKLYRLLGGSHHPEMLAARGEVKSAHSGKKRYYRLSKDLPDFHEWTYFNSYSHLKCKKPIKGLTSIFLIADFLADLDQNTDNFGLIEYAECYAAVKLDPEGCFSYEFHDDSANVESILSQFSEIQHEVPDQQFNNQEFLETLEHIISTPLSHFTEIINSAFSPEYEEQRKIYISRIAKRIELYKQAAFAIPGFQKIYEQRQEMVRLERECIQEEKYQEYEQNYKQNAPQQSKNQKWLEEMSTQPQFRPYAGNPQGFFSNQWVSDNENSGAIGVNRP